MATIKEDYVSFETAKLLKEKGFLLTTGCYEDWVCCMYDTNGNIKWGCYSSEWYYRITLQMAMKWLRDVHNVFISVNIGNHKKDNRDTSMPDFVYYFFYITDTKAVYEEEKQCHKEFSTFEEACEAAIKYCLENLI